MSTTIKIKRSAVEGKAPNTSVLELGELALNTYDGKLFFKKNDGSDAIVTLSDQAAGIDANNISSGTLDAARLADSGVTANTYGNTTAIPVLTVDAKGRITVATTANITDISSLAYDSANGVVSIGTADAETFTATLDLDAFDTDGLTEGANNLYYTVDRANTVIHAQVPGIITSNVTTAFINGLNVDADTVDGYEATELLDFTNATNKPDPKIDITLTGEVTGTGNTTLTDLANGAITIDVELSNTTVTAGEYGNATSIPVIEVDEDGRLTNASVVTVAGVSSASWSSTNNTLTIATADGGSYPVTIEDWDADTVTIANAEIEDLFANNFDVTTINRDPTVTVTLDGDLSGSASATLTNLANGTITLTANVNQVQENSIALGADTTGNYIATIAGTANEVEVSGSGSENAAVTIGLPDDVTIPRDLVVSGNLTVSGTTTTVNTEEVNIADNIINLNSNVDGVTDPTEDGGISVNRGSNGAVTLIWNETEDYWTVGTEKFVAGDLQGTLPFSNVSSVPSPNVTITIDGDVEGTGSAELTNLGTDASISVTLELTNTGVTAGEYGNASSVPIITVDEDGRVTNATEVSVAGVSSATWYSANNTLQIDTADGGSYPVTIEDWDADTVTIANAEIETINRDPNITVTLDGDVEGTANATLTNLANGSITITTDLSNTGVTAGEYGNASSVPVITVDEDGRITNASEVSVAGVANVQWYSANNTLQINTADGGNYPITIEDWDADTVTIANAEIEDLFANNFDVTTINRDPNITVTLDGDLSGTANTTLTNLANGSITITANVNGVQVNTVALGTDTTGNYVSDVTGTTNEIEVTHTPGEGSSPQIGLPANVTITDTLTSNQVSITTYDRDPTVTVTLSGDLSGTASATLTNLANGEISLSANVDGVQANSVALGTDTTGNYMSDVTGTANEIEVTHTPGEGSSAQVGLPANVTIEDSLTANQVTITTYDRDPNIQVSLTGDVTGTANTTLTNLANGTISITTDVETDYVGGINGTANEIDVTGSGGANAGVTVGLANDVTIAANLTVTADATANVLNILNYIDLANVDHPTHNEGRFFYDDVHKTLNFNNDITNLQFELGTNEYIRVFNETGSTIPNGAALYLDGYTSTDPVVPKAQLADASSAATYNTSGLAAASIANGQYGYCAVSGVVRGSDSDPFDTSYLTAGVRAFVSATTPGDLQQPAPKYPNYPMCMGLVVVSDANNGVFVVEQQMHAVPQFRVAGDVYVGADLTVAGDLSVLGSETVTTLTNISVADTFFYLGTGDTISNTVFTGTGLDDALYEDYYNGTETKTYSVRIDGVGTGTGGVDTFEWSVDNFATTEATGVDITADAQLLEDHIKIHFTATTGHTSGDRWDGDVAPSNLDFGVTGNYSNSTLYSHAGFFRDASDEEFKFFKRYDPEVEGSIDTSNNTFEYADLRANSFFGHTITANVVGDVTGTVSDISNHNTAALAEGTNLYYTVARANSAIDARVDKAFVNALAIDYSSLTGAPTIPANTSLSSAAWADANNTLTFTRADASTTDVNISFSEYLTSSDLPANTSTTSATYTGSNNTTTFTRADSSTFDVTMGEFTNMTLSGTTNIGAEMELTSNSTVSRILHAGGILDTLQLGANSESSVFIRGGYSNPSVGIGVEQGIHNLAVKGNLAVNNSIMIGDEISNLQSGSAGSLSAFEVYTQGAQSGYIEGRGTTAAFTVASNGAYFSSLEASANGQGQVALYHYRDTTILAPSYAANGDSALSSTGTLNITGTDGTVVRGDLEVTGRSKFSVSTFTVSAVGNTVLDVGATDNFHITLGANTTFELSNMSDKIGGSGTIVIIQAATGGHEFTLAPEMKTPVNGATISQSTGSNEISVISYYVVSSSQMLINYIGDFA